MNTTAEAEPLYKQALESNRRVLGEDHTNTIALLDDYANVLKSLGRLSEAEHLYREAVTKALMNASLGAKHAHSWSIFAATLTVSS